MAIAQRTRGRVEEALEILQFEGRAAVADVSDLVERAPPETRASTFAV
jgi:hypothetical protein